MRKLSFQCLGVFHDTAMTYEQATEQQRWHDFVHLFLDRRLSSILELNTRSTSLNSIKMISDDSFSHRLLFLVPDENFNLQKFCFPSKFVEELIVLAHSLQVE